MPFTEEERAAFNREHVAFLGDNKPASTLVFVHRLMDPRWLVEIDALAAGLADAADISEFGGWRRYAEAMHL